MRIQTLARELALKALYQHDLMGGRSEQELRAFCHENAKPEVANMAMDLVAGCIEKQDSIDDIIRRTAENWELERMATTDRNILRMGVYELLYRPETPPKVAINEAIELAKKFSTENSPVFVNGVLDRIYTTQVENAPGEAEATPESPTAAVESAVLPDAAGDGETDPPGARPDPMARADLHVHSTASDGSVAPEDLPALAARAGIAAIALTDHDSVEGVAAARRAAAEAGIELVPGVELTGYAPPEPGGADVEVHISGLFVDPLNPALLERLRHLRAVREDRIEQMVRKLATLGVAIETKAVLARAAGGAVGRVHVAEELVAKGFCTGIAEAFNLYIGNHAPGYVPKERMTPQEAIALVHEAGGCAVLCHPALLPDLDKRAAELAQSGLDGVEVHYPMHTPEDEKRCMDLAHGLGLVVTGGSDFHGEAKPDIHVGQQAVSYVELEQLRQRARRPQQVTAKPGSGGDA